MDIPIYDYPGTGVVNPNVLYDSLGTFWTQIFREKATLRGITLTHSEELIQHYYDLIETINSFSVKDIPIFHKEKWLPVIIYKSKFNQEPLRFNPNDVIFGSQPESDVYYQSVTFQFGLPKIPTAEVYVYEAGDVMQSFSVLANNIIKPTVVFVNSVDAVYQNGVLFFNKNIFNNPDLVSVPLINELGVPQVYTDGEGMQQQEEIIILWAYHADVDKNLLYDNFGYIFDILNTNDVFYKKMLTSLMSMYTDGPTVSNIKTVCSAFLGLDTIKEPTEIVEEVFTSDQHYVVTDKNVYKFPLFYDVLPNIKVGASLNVGEVMVDAIEYYDNVTFPEWWKRGKITAPVGQQQIPYFSLSSGLFLGNYKYQLSFKTDVDIVSYDTAGLLHFPVRGTPADVALFNSTINTPEMRAALGLVNPGDVAVVNPVDFLFTNFLKNNTAFIKLKFINNNLTSSFLKLLSSVQDLLPKHVYFIFALDMVLPTETLNTFNDNIPVSFASGEQLLNADGSNSFGIIEDLAPFGYQNLEKRLFSIGLSPNPPLPTILMRSNVTTSVINDTAVPTAAGATIRCGSSTTGIANPIHPIPTGISTMEYGNLLLLNFL